jgi:hypothetical protein
MNAPSKEIVVESNPWQGQAVAMAQPVSETAALLAMIDRVARDPDFDLEKMKSLIAMRNAELERQAKLSFNRAMKAAQQAMPQVVRDKMNDQTRSMYAKYETISEAMQPVIGEHGFSLSFGEADSPKANHIRITCDVMHDDGHVKPVYVDMPFDNAGIKGNVNKTPTHGLASTITYGRRVLKTMIFDVAVKGQDDDGNSGSTAPADDAPISKAQLKELRDLLDKAGADVAEFCEFGGVASLADITVRSFPNAIAAATAKLNYKGAAK